MKTGEIIEVEGVKYIAQEEILACKGCHFEYPDNVKTTIIAKVSILEFMELRTSLGVGKLVREEANVSVDAEA